MAFDTPKFYIIYTAMLRYAVDCRIYMGFLCPFSFYL